MLFIYLYFFATGLAYQLSALRYEEKIDKKHFPVIIIFPEEL